MRNLLLSLALLALAVLACNLPGVNVEPTAIPSATPQPPTATPQPPPRDFNPGIPEEGEASSSLQSSAEESAHPGKPEDQKGRRLRWWPF